MAQYTANPSSRRGPSPWAHGWRLFAGIMMVVGGIMEFLYGIMATLHDAVIVTTPRYAFRFDTTAWGVIHIVLGALLVLIGVGVLGGRTWARVIGIFIVALSAIGNFLSLPYSPFWSLVLLAIDIFVIWGLSTSSRPDVA